MTQRKGQLTLLLIALVFFLPMAGAMYLYLSDIEWRPAESTVKGDLILPPRPLPDSPITPDTSPQLFREVWSMLVLSDGPCDAVCQEALVHMRQVRLSLGPKMTRIQTVYLPATDGALPDGFLAEHPALIIGLPEATDALRTAIGGFENGEIYLVDPFGNLMMRYPPGADMSSIRADIKHLFELSRIG